MTLIRRLILALALMAGLPAFAAPPPPVPALPDSERRTSYSISGTTCACSVGFALFGDSTDFGNWIEVWLNGALVPSTNYIITSPSGSLATLPRPITDAVLTFNSVQTGTVQIVGARRPRRASQFNENQGVAARDFNQALTDLVAQNRETWDRTNDVTSRTARVPPGETLALLPVLASRMNQGACFDNLGNLSTCVSVPSSTFAAGSGIVFTGTNPTTISAPPASIMFTQNGTGAVPVTLSSILQTIVTPEQFGAACNGTGDDGPAIQRAINSSTSPHRVLFSSTCTYRVVTGYTWGSFGLSLEGASPQFPTKIDFEPGADGTLITINGSGTRLYWNSIRNFYIYSTDTTHTKTAIKTVDLSETVIENVHVSGGAADDSTFTGGTGSTCLQVNGRDTTLFRNLILSCSLPLVLNVDPNVSTESADHFHFTDMSLVGDNSNPCITVASGAVLTNVLFDGYQAWQRCTYGFYANDTASTTNWHNLAFFNVRTEQSTNSSGYSFYISPKSSNRLVDLLIVNGNFDINMQGVYLRRVQNGTIANSVASCSGTPTLILDLDNSNDAINLINDHWETACTAGPSSGTPMTLQSAGSYPSTASSTIPANAVYGKQQVSSPTFMNMMGMPKISATGVAPGAGLSRFELVAGTSGGTCKLILYAGTSTTPTTVIDNVGSGC